MTSIALSDWFHTLHSAIQHPSIQDDVVNDETAHYRGPDYNDLDAAERSRAFELIAIASMVIQPSRAQGDSRRQTIVAFLRANPLQQPLKEPMRWYWATGLNRLLGTATPKEEVTQLVEAYLARACLNYWEDSATLWLRTHNCPRFEEYVWDWRWEQRRRRDIAAQDEDHQNIHADVTSVGMGPYST